MNGGGNLRCLGCHAVCEASWKTPRGWVCPSCNHASEDNGLPVVNRDAAFMAWFGMEALP